MPAQKRYAMKTYGGAEETPNPSLIS